MFRDVLANVPVCWFASWCSSGTELWDSRGLLLSRLCPVLACGSLVTCVPGMNQTTPVTSAIMQNKLPW